jgi:hypothetical protein
MHATKFCTLRRLQFQFQTGYDVSCDGAAVPLVRLNFRNSDQVCVAFHTIRESESIAPRSVLPASAHSQETEIAR